MAHLYSVGSDDPPAEAGFWIHVEKKMSTIWPFWCEMNEQKSSELFPVVEKGQDGLGFTTLSLVMRHISKRLGLNIWRWKRLFRCVLTLE